MTSGKIFSDSSSHLFALRYNIFVQYSVVICAPASVYITMGNFFVSGILPCKLIL